MTVATQEKPHELSGSDKAVDISIDPTPEPKSEADPRGVDVAFDAFQESQGKDITEAEFKRVLRKIDLHLMP